MSSQTKKSIDLIDEYVEIIKPYCDSPDSFIVASGYYLISDLLGRYFHAPNLPQRARPNLWIILASIPGRMRRSSILHYAEYVRDKVLRIFYEGLGIPKDEISDLIYDTTIESGTPEGIADKIQEAGQDVYRIINGEIGTFFIIANNISYMQGVLTLFSKLYYGEGYSGALSRKSGSNKDRRIPKGIYVTLFAGMQEPWRYIKRSMTRQGLLRRILILYEEKNPNHLPPVNLTREFIYDDLDDYATKLGKLMLSFHEEANKLPEPNLIDILVAPEAIDNINDLARQLDEEVNEESNDINIYKQSLWEHKAKLAMVRRIAKGELKDIMGKKSVILDLDDIKLAEGFLLPIMGKVNTWIDKLDITEGRIISHETILEQIYRKIKEEGKEGISRTDLHNKFKKIDAKTMREHIGTLIVQARVIQDLVPTKGAPKTVYYSC